MPAEAIIQSPAKCGEPPFPMKNKNNLNVSLSLIGFFQKINFESSGHLDRG